LKTFLLDTNVLLHDPDCLKVFGNNKVVIPISVLDELDKHKGRPDEVGRNARTIARTLDSLRKEGCLSDGVKIENTIIMVEIGYSNFVPEALDPGKVDNKLLSTALGLMKEGENVIVVSKDITVRVKCDALKITAEDYEKDKVASRPEAIYGGVSTMFVNSEIIDELFANKSINLNFQSFPNEYVILKSNTEESKSAIARCVKNGTFVITKLPKDAFGIVPRNTEQRLALDLLLNPEIKLVTIIGKAGSGKTLMACAAALEQANGIGGLTKDAPYRRILISRPIQPMGKDLGFLPGDISEKLNPWMQPIYDNLELLLGTYNEINNYKEDGIIQVEPLTYIRGRSIPNSYMLVDECQNLSPKEIKTIITRMGDDSKIILTGDIEQIDNTYIDFSNNGLSYVVEKFKDYDIAGHITLRKGERSKLATIASEIL
jgi:PhoH-like ATPase